MRTSLRQALLALPCAGIALLFGAREVRADVVLVANPDVPVDAISLDDAARLYLGALSRLGNVRVVLTTQAEGAAHEEFLRLLLRRTPTQFRNHWFRVVFSGHGALPRSLRTEQEVVDFVARTPGAVGYVTTATPPGATKALLILSGSGDDAS